MLCLACGHAGCPTHAEMHHARRRHPLSMELSGARRAICRLCDATVSNDTRHGDLKLLRSVLDDVEHLHPRVARTRSGATSRTSEGGVATSMGRDAASKWRMEDKKDTAEAFRKGSLRLRALRAWRDAAAHQASQAPPTLAFLTPETPPAKKNDARSTSGVYKLVPGRTGLRNLGNTCWANAVVQALSNTVPFRQYLLELHRDGRWKEKLMERESNRMEDVPGTRPNFSTTSMRLRSQAKEDLCHESNGAADEVLLSLEVRNLLKDLWSGKWVLVSPTSLIAAIWNVLPAFKGFRQHDAHEFFLFLVERINQETMRAGVPVDDFKSNTSGHVFNKTGCRMQTGSSGLLQETFCGATETVVTCVHCGRVSTREEPFTEISLDFPQEEQNGVRGERRRMEGQKMRLESCLQYFARETDLPDYCCEGCGRLGATRQVRISKLPEVLCFHVQRLIWTAVKQEKITRHVEPPLSGLCMQPYCTSSIGSEFWQYDMVALITHKGHSFGTGHYECFCFNSVKNLWYLFNDSRVKECTKADVVEAEAYMIIYIKRGVSRSLQDTADFLDDAQSSPVAKRQKLES